MSKVSNKQQYKFKFLKWIYKVSLIICVLYLLYDTILKKDKIAYVDSGRILNEYKGSVEAKQIYQAKAKVWQNNIDTLTAEVRNAMQKYERSLATMTPQEQSLYKQLIQTKQKQLSDYQRAIQENARQADAQLTQGVISQVNAFISRYGKLHNYKLILIANQSGTIAYAQEGLDITTTIIDELNKDFAKK